MKTLLVALLTYAFYRALYQWRLHLKSFSVRLRDMQEGNERFMLVLGHALLPATERVVRDLERTMHEEQYEVARKDLHE